MMTEGGGGGKDTRMEDLVVCSICLEDFKECSPHHPRMLPCGHSFCHGCLAKMASSGKVDTASFECPKCRRTTAFTKVEELPINYDFIALLNHLQERRKEIIRRLQETEAEEKQKKSNNTPSSSSSSIHSNRKNTKQQQGEAQLVCRRKGCGQTYSRGANHPFACTYHTGVR